MKNNRSPRGGRSLLGVFLLLAATAQGSNDVPTGTLSVDRNLVRVGVNSQLGWNITHPVDEVVDIVPPNRIVPKKDVTMKVRVLGVAFQDGRGRNMPAKTYYSKNSSSWAEFFYGNEADVNPSEVVLSDAVSSGDTIDFGAKAYLGGWLPFYSTAQNTQNVKVLKNGDTPPTHAPAFRQGDIVSFLAPYLDAGGKVNIGDRDLIVLWESYSTRPGSYYFDMQDVVLLVTFE